MAQLSEYDIENRHHAIVRQSRRLTPTDTDEVRELQLEITDPGFACEVDQSFGVLVESKREFGNSFHHRLYSVADLPGEVNGHPLITCLVKRCRYVDDFSGEEYPGVASNYLCDRKPGDEITLTGPFALPFAIPEDNRANLILIGMGTGIAPFRAFIKHIYHVVGEWKGQIRLFYGARSGLELLYLNDEDGDLTNYYDKETFEAFSALSPRPHWSDPIALDQALLSRREEIRTMLNSANTYVYVAGYDKLIPLLDKAFGQILGAPERWIVRKNELIAGKKWAEVIY